MFADELDGLLVGMGGSVVGLALESWGLESVIGLAGKSPLRLANNADWFVESARTTESFCVFGELGRVLRRCVITTADDSRVLEEGLSDGLLAEKTGFEGCAVNSWEFAWGAVATVVLTFWTLLWKVEW